MRPHLTPGSRLTALLLALMTSAGNLAAGPLSVSELNYSDPEGGDYDFIELVNAGAASLSLTGVRFTVGVTYTFTTTVPLNAGERIVVVRDRTKFQARYGTAGIRLAEGTFSGGFSANGELVTVVDPAGAPLIDFTYGVDGRWPSRPNGLGSTLECIDPLQDLNDPDHWRPSSEWLGSPGRAGAGPQRRVAINEILAHTDPPYEDAVELLNLTDESIRLDGWYLSNGRADPTKYIIPRETVLAPRGRKVFYEYQFDPNAPPTGQTAFRFNSANGDEAVLMSADASGRPLFWMDVVSFGATANGVSLGRYPEGTGPLTTQWRQTFGTDLSPTLPPDYLAEFRTGAGAPNAGPLVGPLVFSRIQYQPKAGEDEYLELQNKASVTVPLYDPEYPANTWRIRDGVDFDFPPGVNLDPSARLLVVGIDPAVFRTKYAVAASIPVFGPWTNVLANSGERIALFKPDPPQLPPHPDAGFVPYILVEEIDYSPLPPWPTEAAGLGPALRRRDITQFGNDPANWEADAVVPPVTPEVSLLQGSTSLQLSFTAQAGRTYRLQAAETRDAAVWTELGVIPVPPAGGLVTVEITPTGNSRLLRVTAE
jgi:Lamin Tail Domain